MTTEHLNSSQYDASSLRPIYRLRSDFKGLRMSMSSRRLANRILNIMSDQERRTENAPETQPTSLLAADELQRRRFDVIDVLAETLVALLLKRQAARPGGRR